MYQINYIHETQQPEFFVASLSILFEVYYNLILYIEIIM